MKHRLSGAVTVGCLSLLLALPGVAAAKTKVVDMGTPLKNAQDFQKLGSDVNDFFPHGITIRKGQKVKFVPTGFHSLNLPAKGGGPLPLITPTSTPANVNDEAGAPFWFNGQPALGFNPAMAPPGLFGKKVTYTGKKMLESGLPLGNALKPITVKFKKTGKVTYFCDIHPGMTGTVTVKKKGARIPSAKADRKRLKKQVARDLKIAKGLSKVAVPDGTVEVGVPGKHGVEFFDFLPKTVTVPVGTTLKFRMQAASYETHTATAGPGDPGAEADSYLKQLAASFEAPVIDPRATYPSDLPPAPAVLTPTLHGNGFWNSGAIDGTAATPLPDSNSVTFGQAGTYTFYCLVHPFMKGTVIAQ